MDTRYQRIEKYLTETLQPSVLEIIDESNNHRVPVGSESHFKLTIVALKFIGLNRVARHQLVYTCLAPELTTGLHALSLRLYTPEEWRKQPNPMPSPSCQHKPSTDRDFA
jgi:BolA protein